MMRLYIRYTFLIVCINCSIYGQTLSTSLTACYAFDNSVSEPISNLTATLGVVSPTVNRFNTANTAFAFNGTNASIITLPNSALLKPTNELTFSAWIKVNPLPPTTGCYILYTKNTSSINFEAYSLTINYLGSGVYKFAALKGAGGLSSVCLATSSVVANTWYHVAITMDNSTLKIYVNGSLENTTSTSLNFTYDSNGKVLFGGTNESFNLPFTGTIDNARFYNRILSASEIASLYSADPVCVATTTVTSLSNSLTACYSLDGNANDPINALNGTVTSAVTSTVNRFNVANSAYYFSGSSTSYIELPDDPLLKPSSAISFAVWLKPNNTNASHIIYTKNNLTSNFEAYQLCIFSGAPVFRVNKSSSLGNNIALSTSTIVPGTWYHIACTIDNSEIKLYLNGVLQGSASTTFSGFDYQTGKKVYLGDSHESFSFPYNGSMDNLRFYNRTLTSAEINALYTADPTCVTTTTSNTSSTSASFVAPDTICVNQTFTLQNTSTGSVISNYWSACNSTASANTQTFNTGTVTGLANPVFLSLNKDGANHYIFVSNNNPSSLARMDYGGSYLNTPTVTNLGNLGGNYPLNGEGLWIEKEGSNWYGIAVGGPSGSDRISRINFGNSLANTPTAVNMGNIGGLNYPHRIAIFRSGGNVYGFTVNRSNNTLTRFDFGSSIANTPTGTNLGNIGNLNSPSDFALINYQGNWYAFVTNDVGGTISRLDFGNSLTSTPTGTNLGTLGGLGSPRAISLWQDCNGIQGIIHDAGLNSEQKLNFLNGATGSLSLTSLGNIAAFSFPHSMEITRIGNDLTAFVANVNTNSISRITYPGCAAIPSSTQQNAVFTFTTPGTYTISLICNEGRYDQSAYCKTIFVEPLPSLTVSSNPQVLCSGNSATLTVSGANSYSWQPGNLAGSVIQVNPSSSTIYSITGASNNGCISNLLYTLSVTPGLSVNITPNTTSVCPGNSVTLNAAGGTSYTWNPGGIIGSSISVSPVSSTIYTVTGSNGGCESTATASVNIGLQLTLTASGNLCNNTTVDLNVSPTSTATSILWSGPGIVGSNSSSIITVNAGGVYSVTVTDTVTNCNGTGTINVISINNPFSLTIVPSSTSACYPGPAVNFLVNAPLNLSWLPANEVNPNTGPLVSVNPSVTTTYTVIGTLGACSASTSITISANITPTVSLSENQYSVCSLSTITVSANGAGSYLWLPGNQQTDTASFLPFTSNSTSYVYTVTGFNGNCSNTQTFVMNVEPGPSLTVAASPATICIGNTSTLSASGAVNYFWQSPIGNSNNSNFIVTPSVTSQYTVTGTNSLGCSSDATLQLVVINSPAISAAGSSSNICAGESVTLSASGAASYTWLPIFFTGSPIVVTPSISTTYTVTSDNSNCNYATIVVLVNNCVNTSFGISNAVTLLEPSGSNYYKIRFTVTVENASTSDLSELNLNDNLQRTFPFPCSFTLQSKPQLVSVNSLLSINPNFDGLSDFNLTTAGTSTLSSNKRDTILIDLILEPKGFAGLTKNTVVGTALDLNAIVVADSSNNGFDIDPDLDGNPTNNNTETPIVINPLTLFIPEGFSPNGDGNYDRFEIGGLNGKTISLTVYNRWGNKVYSNANYDNSWEGTANVSATIGKGKLPEGTYYYIIEFNDGSREPINGFVVLKY